MTPFSFLFMFMFPDYCVLLWVLEQSIPQISHEICTILRYVIFKKNHSRFEVLLNLQPHDLCYVKEDLELRTPRNSQMSQYQVTNLSWWIGTISIPARKMTATSHCNDWRPALRYLNETVNIDNGLSDCRSDPRWTSVYIKVVQGACIISLVQRLTQPGWRQYMKADQQQMCIMIYNNRYLH